jgi:hypothetical protein
MLIRMEGVGIANLLLLLLPFLQARCTLQGRERES